MVPQPQNSTPNNFSLNRLIITVVVLLIIVIGTFLNTMGIISNVISATFNALSLTFAFFQWFIPMGQLSPLPTQLPAWLQKLLTKKTIFKSLVGIVVGVPAIIGLLIILLHPSTSTAFLFQSIPYCDSSRNTKWNTPLPGTFLSCSNVGLTMQQNRKDLYAEVDLDSVDGKTYNQMNFRVQVQGTFQNIEDEATFAALIVQTPQAQGVAGGYILRVNSAGEWELQRVDSRGVISPMQYGLVNLSSSKSVTLTVAVKDDMLYGYINSNQVVASSSNITNTSESRSVGLIVERENGSASSPVVFTNFELDQ